MCAKRRAESTASSVATAPQSEEERKVLLDQEIEKDEKLAESEWELAEWFTNNGRDELARRRLEKIVKHYPRSSFFRRAKSRLGSDA